MKHITSKFPKDASGILKEQSPSEGKKAGFNNTELNIVVEVDNMEVDESDIDDLLPVGNPILVNIIEHHADGLQPVDHNIDIVGNQGFKYPNRYAPFLDKDQFEFAFCLVKYGINIMAIDDIMSLPTVKSNLPKGHSNLHML